MVKSKKKDYALITGNSRGSPQYHHLLGYLQRMKDCNDVVLIYGPQDTSRDLIFNFASDSKVEQDKLPTDKIFMSKLEKLTKNVNNEHPVFIGKIRILNLETFKKATKQIKKIHPALEFELYQLSQS